MMTNLARLALFVGVASGVAALLAGPAYRMHGLGLGEALQVMRWAVIGGLAGAVLAVPAIAVNARRPARVPVLAIGALLLNAAVATPPLWLYWQAQTLPRIHDVSTDTGDPPAFVAVQKLRAQARNPTAYDPQTAELQKRGYPDIVPLHLSIAPAQAFSRAGQAVRALGWTLVASVPAEGRLEATDTTLLFGFEDDVVVRIRPEGSGTRIDVRSLSRVGGSDFGTNARRVRAFLRRMTDDGAG